MGLGDPKTCVYQFIFDEYDSNDTNITQYFIMNVLGLSFKSNSIAAHMFYKWSLSNNTSVQTSINQNTYFLSLNTCTTVFSWVSDNPN